MSCATATGCTVVAGVQPSTFAPNGDLSILSGMCFVLLRCEIIQGRFSSDATHALRPDAEGTACARQAGSAQQWFVAGRDMNTAVPQAPRLTKKPKLPLMVRLCAPLSRELTA